MEQLGRWGLVSSASIAVLARVVIAGIKEAGFYEVLSSNSLFSAKDLITASRFLIKDAASSNGSGVYIRLHKTGSQVIAEWKPHSSYIYTGKTKNFAERNDQHKTTASRYGDLNRNSTVVSMIALCILPVDGDDGLYYLTEQMIICLLETYRPDAAYLDSAKLHMLRFCQTARYFVELAEELFHMTDWQVFLRRGVNFCGVQFGANCSSPLVEFSSQTDRSLFICTDVNIKDGETGSVVPMAFYRRSDRVVANKSGNGSHVFEKRVNVNGSRQSVILLRLERKQSVTALDLPPPGSHLEFVIEVVTERWNTIPQCMGTASEDRPVPELGSSKLVCDSH